MVESIKIEGTGYIQTADEIHNGANIEDIDYLSKKNLTETMNEIYDTKDIIDIVNGNPNLHFSIIWSGTEEEYEKMNRSEIPPYITAYISGE